MFTLVYSLFETKLNAPLTSSSLTKTFLIMFAITAASFLESREHQQKTLEHHCSLTFNLQAGYLVCKRKACKCMKSGIKPKLRLFLPLLLYKIQWRYFPTYASMPFGSGVPWGSTKKE